MVVMMGWALPQCARRARRGHTFPRGLYTGSSVPQNRTSFGCENDAEAAKDSRRSVVRGVGGLAALLTAWAGVSDCQLD